MVVLALVDRGRRGDLQADRTLQLILQVLDLALHKCLQVLTHNFPPNFPCFQERFHSFDFILDSFSVDSNFFAF